MIKRGLLSTLFVSFQLLAFSQQQGDTFKDCDTCLKMAAVPAGSTKIGSYAEEIDRKQNEGPRIMLLSSS